MKKPESNVFRQSYGFLRRSRVLLYPQYNELRKQWMRRLWRFNKAVWSHFWRDDCLNVASALTFTSLLALVPFFSLSFGILAALPWFDQIILPLQDFIFEHFVPTTGEVIQTHITAFIDQAKRLSMFEIVFFSTFALMTLYTIEMTFNQIWRVSNHRNSIWAFILYWGVLIFSPIILGSSFLLSSYLFSLSWLQKLASEYVLTTNGIIYILPFLLTWISLSLLYIIVPNCRVRVLHGLIGAFVATLFIELAKKMFIYYFTYFHTYELLYGAFAAIPIFFIWLYWLWVIILFGAVIVYLLDNKPYKRF